MDSIYFRCFFLFQVVFPMEQAQIVWLPRLQLPAWVDTVRDTSSSAWLLGYRPPSQQHHPAPLSNPGGRLCANTLRGVCQALREQEMGTGDMSHSLLLLGSHPVSIPLASSSQDRCKLCSSKCSPRCHVSRRKIPLHKRVFSARSFYSL